MPFYRKKVYPLANEAFNTFFYIDLINDFLSSYLKIYTTFSIHFSFVDYAYVNRKLTYFIRRQTTYLIENEQATAK